MPNLAPPDPAAGRNQLIAAYLARGWAVFPLGRGKRPLPNCEACRAAGASHDPAACACLTCHGFYAASSDPERVELLFSMYPDHPIGLRTGAASGVFVLDAEAETDADGSPTGLTALDRFAQIAPGVELPATLAAASESGGVHLFYRHVAGVSARNRIAAALDVKGEGGYVVLPDGDGTRRWLDGPDAPADPGGALIGWLAGRRGGTGQEARAGSPDAPVGYDFSLFTRDGCPDGFRDHFFNDLAFRLRKAGTDRERAREIARGHWERAEQPPAARYHMPWTDVEYKLDRVWAGVEPDPEPDPRAAAWAAGLTVTATPVQAGVQLHVQEMPRRELPTDRGNAERLVRLHGDRVRYLTASRAWLVWDGARWERDTLDRVSWLARQLAEDVRVQADKLMVEGRTEDAKLWAGWSLKCESLRTIQAALRMAAADPLIATSPEQCDADPDLLAVGNGVVDLRTGELRGARREDLITRRAQVAYDPEATCPGWREHVKLVTGGDADLAAYLQRAVGYTLTGRTDAQCFFMLEGNGFNGKSAFVEALVALLGEYATVSSSALLTGGDEQHPTILADLQGARLVYVDEARQGRPLNAERIKALTGSRTVSARRMGQDFFRFSPQLKLWISGNNHPSMRDPSDGIWRRMHRVMFNAKIPTDRRVADYGLILHRQEAAGILNWALEGLAGWRELGGLAEPTGVVDAVAEVRAEEDHVGQFVEECCLVGPEHESGAAELYTQFCIWAMGAGVPTRLRMSRVEFGRALRARGFADWRKRVDGRVVRGFGGIAGVLLADGEVGRAGV